MFTAANVMAFTFSDLVVLPILRIQRKYYGLKMEMYIIGECFSCASLVFYFFSLRPAAQWLKTLSSLLTDSSLSSTLLSF